LASPPNLSPEMPTDLWGIVALLEKVTPEEQCAKPGVLAVKELLSVCEAPSRGRLCVKRPKRKLESLSLKAMT
jgi:hypothetical protein